MLAASGICVVLDGRVIVDGIVLDVADGEMVGLVGPNGSGKSTLLRTVYRALRPRAGLVALDGTDVWSLSPRSMAQRTAVVVQEPANEFDFRVHDIVAMGRMPHLGMFSISGPGDERIVEEALAQAGVAELATRRFQRLSGGEKQRVLIARALAQRCRFLVLDEPTNHLDVRHQFEVLELTRRLGLATLTALHDLNLAASYCDRLYLLDGGRVVAHGRPHDVLSPERIRAVFGIDAVRTVHPETGRPLLAFHPLGG